MKLETQIPECDMTPEQVSFAVSEGLIENRVVDFYEAGRLKTGNKIVCPKSRKISWEMFCGSLKDVPMPAKD